MSLRKLPQIKAFSPPSGYQWEAPADIQSKWSGPQAAEADSGTTISIYDVIGSDPWSGDGFTAKRLAGALRAAGESPVEVLINSPGGDMFEGLAIYNLLRDHPAEVTVKVVGMAASAASIIAMAGDKIVMGAGSFMMIHNCWGVVIGNQNDMRSAADTFSEFDAAMTEIYEARTGQPKKSIEKMMDAETWLRASEAIRLGFADETIDAKEPSAQGDASGELAAKSRLDLILAKAGMARSERRKLMREIAGTQDAASNPATHDAGQEVQAALKELLSTMSIV